LNESSLLDSLHFFLSVSPAVVIQSILLRSTCQLPSPGTDLLCMS
jgi:hypothetical protein